MKIVKRLATQSAFLLIFLPATLPAQGLTFQMGRLFDDGGWTVYNLGWNQPLLGPFEVQASGVLMRGPGQSERLFGGGVDASLFRGGQSGLYLVGGVGGGIGTGSAEEWWRGWSAGLGYELVPLQFLSLGVETRYREMEPSRRAGAELAFRISTAFSGGRNAPSGTSREPPPLPQPGPVSTRESSEAAGPARPPRLATAASLVDPDAVSADALASDVIEIAEGELGTRYRFGGTGPGDGFDCSGLIQYAYRKVGIELPRRSVDQARAGREIGRDESALRPGDVLTFSSRGGVVTHVGMYMGNGRFIHSASKGVQVSTLGEADPNGRWWYRRWVGARRIIEND